MNTDKRCALIEIGYCTEPWEGSSRGNRSDEDAAEARSHGLSKHLHTDSFSSDDARFPTRRPASLSRNNKRPSPKRRAAHYCLTPTIHFVSLAFYSNAVLVTAVARGLAATSRLAAAARLTAGMSVATTVAREQVRQPSEI